MTAVQRGGPGTPILHPFLGLLLSFQHTVSLAGAVHEAQHRQKSFAREYLQCSALLAAKTRLGSRVFAPHLQSGSRRKSPGCCRAEKLQLCSFHTIPMAGRYLDSLLLSSAGDK